MTCGPEGGSNDITGAAKLLDLIWVETNFSGDFFFEAIPELASPDTCVFCASTNDNIGLPALRGFPVFGGKPMDLHKGTPGKRPDKCLGKCCKVGVWKLSGDGPFQAHRKLFPRVLLKVNIK